MRLEFVAIPVALITIWLTVMGSNGGLSGGAGGCGQWGLNCAAVAGGVLLAGTAIGALLALTCLTQSRWKSAFGWFWLILNGVPAIGLGLLGLYLFLPR